MSENFENRNEEENPIDERVWVAEEYLKKIEKDNGISQEIIAESLERLKRPLKRVDYKDFGEAEVKAENSEFSFSYILPSDQLKDEVDKYVFFKRLNDLCPDKPLELQDWRKLENMTFQVEDKKVSLLELLPENYNIIFNPSSEIFHGSVTDRNIYILGDITAPISIVTLLHEIGHIYDYKNSEKRSDNPQIEFGLHKETAETIRKERAASAFALKAMRPFLRKPQLKADVINFLENYALESYNVSARRNFEVLEKERPFLERESNREMGEWVTEQKEMLEQQLWNDFIEWKNTKTYEGWKNLSENKNIKDDEEFGVWKEWLEKIGGYEYWKKQPQ